MNQLSYIRSRINALRRKMALEISVVSLEPVADEFCFQWDRARAEGRPAPDILAFIRKIGAAGYWLPTLVAAHKYLEKCIKDNIVPGVQHLMATLLPWAVVRGLVVPSADPPPMSMSLRAET